MSSTALFQYLAEETAQAVPCEVNELYASFCARMRRPEGAVVGLFYGSALWKTPETDTVWDIYLLVDHYADVSRKRLLMLAGALLPPNVYYHSMTHADGRMLRSKIAVMTMAQFTRHSKGYVLAPQTWARFAQATRLIAPRDTIARAQVVAALAEAVLTFHRATAPWLTQPLSIEQFWQLGLTHTYASEFRAERSNRQQSLVDASREALVARSHYAIAQGCISGMSIADGLITSHYRPASTRARQGLQRLRNALSKLQHVLRLIKAAFTFVGGLEYLIYKIERHSGVKLSPGPFARAYPLLGVWPLVLKAWRAGAFR